jgi:hypothetical protein
VRANRRERYQWRLGRHEALHLSGSLICKLHHRLRHRRVPSVASLANLVGASLAVPVRGHVEAQRTHGKDQHNRDERRSTLGYQGSLALKFNTLARCTPSMQYESMLTLRQKRNAPSVNVRFLSAAFAMVPRAIESLLSARIASRCPNAPSVLC